MKIVHVLSLTSILLLPNLAGAELSISTNSLGRVEGIVEFCSKAVPQDAEKFKDAGKQSSQGASDQELTEARKTKEYKEGYKFVTDTLTLLPLEKTAEACSTALEQAK